MLEKSLDPQDKYTLNKTNVAISISNNLTIIDRKFFNEALYISQQNLPQLIYQTPIKTFTKLIGSPNNRQTHRKIMQIFDRLLTKLINIILPTIESFDKTTYLASAKLEDGIIYFQLSESIKNLCIGINSFDGKGNKIIKPYTSLNLNIVNRLTSTFSIALYELLMSKSFANKEIKMDLNTLRDIISSSKYYKDFSRFNDKILKAAIKEINEKTDIKIVLLETIKGEDNKTVEKLRFIVEKINSKPIIVNQKPNKTSAKLEQTTAIYKKENPPKAAQNNTQTNKPIELISDNINEQDLYKQLVEYGVSKKLAVEAINIDYAVALIIKDEILNTKPNILTEGGFGALFCTKWKYKEGYQKKLAAKRQQQQIVQEKKMLKDSQEAQEKQAEEKRHQAYTAKQNHAINIYNNLSFEAKKSLVEETIKNSGLLIKKYSDEQINNIFDDASKVSKLIIANVIEDLTKDFKPEPPLEIQTETIKIEQIEQVEQVEIQAEKTNTAFVTSDDDTVNISKDNNGQDMQLQWNYLPMLYKKELLLKIKYDNEISHAGKMLLSDAIAENDYSYNFISQNQSLLDAVIDELQLIKKTGIMPDKDAGAKKILGNFSLTF